MSIATERRPLVSVIVTTHNRANLLREALGSIYAQEGVGEQFDMEVIVVDDASTDNTAEVVCEYPEARYVRLQTNRRLSGARNAGIKASTGKYIAFLDDDDLFLPHRLRLQVPVLEAQPEVGVVYGQAILRGEERIDGFKDTGPEADRAPSGDVFHAFLMDDFIVVGSLLVRREAFAQAGYFDESITTVEHYDMCLRLAFYLPFVFIPGPVFVVRVSRTGGWFTRLRQGAYERELPYVVEKALGMLPQSEKSVQVRMKAFESVYWRIAGCLSKFAGVDEIHAQTRALVQTYPREKSVVGNVRRLVRTLQKTSDTPIDDLRELFAEIRNGARTCGLGRSEIRQLLGDAWWEAAVGLRWTGSDCRDRAAGYAALRAVCYDPSKLGRTFLKLMARSILAGSGWDPIISSLRGKIG